MLFLGYLTGMSLALLLNVTHQRAFCLRLFYAAVIISAHFYFLPTGRHFYADCGAAQFLILIAALSIRCEAALPIAGMACLAVLVNIASYLNFPAHTGVWNIYYAAINSIQVFQILCLLFVSPITIPVIRKFLTNKDKGQGTWVLRLLEI
jgi:hypothetical protein